jgi:pyruvate ferredoxin oxidoreductase beta subunit
VVHTKIPHSRLPVEEYLKKQGRFKHLFTPERDADLLEEIQERVDSYWATVQQ